MVATLKGWAGGGGGGGGGPLSFGTTRYSPGSYMPGPPVADFLAYMHPCNACFHVLGS